MGPHGVQVLDRRYKKIAWNFLLSMLHVTLIELLWRIGGPDFTTLTTSESHQLMEHAVKFWNKAIKFKKQQGFVLVMVNGLLRLCKMAWYFL